MFFHAPRGTEMEWFDLGGTSALRIGGTSALRIGGKTVRDI
jgi:hypothetical protein